MTLLEWLSRPWAWYVAGPAIAGIMFLLLWAGGEFGVSSTLRSWCAIGGAGQRVPFFNFDWRSQRWNLVFVLGAVVGGWIAQTFLPAPEGLVLSAATIQDLSALGIGFSGELAPREYFSWSGLTDWRGLLMLVGGGFLVGFGTRWAGGCTSGHDISGLANLQLPSLVAVVGFFIGGLLMTWVGLPLLFS